LDPTQRFEPADASHHQVQQDQIGLPVGRLGKGLLTAPGFEHFEVLADQILGQHFAELRLVVDEQDACPWLGTTREYGGAGSRTRARGLPRRASTAVAVNAAGTVTPAFASASEIACRSSGFANVPVTPRPAVATRSRALTVSLRRMTGIVGLNARIRLSVPIP